MMLYQQQQQFQQPAQGLQPPRAGKSRFSKALPSVPMPHDAFPPPPVAPATRPTTAVSTSSSTPPDFRAPAKDLPRLPSLSASQSSPSANTVFNPASSPLPPLPPSKLSSPSSVATLGAPSTKMAISRKPVGKMSTTTPASTTTVTPITPMTATPVTATPKSFELPALPFQTQHEDTTRHELPSPPPPPPLSKEPLSKETVYEMSSVPHSPSDSLSSLLSAYSRSTEDLVLTYPEDTADPNAAMHIRDYDSRAPSASTVQQQGAAADVGKYELSMPTPAPAGTPTPAPAPAAPAAAPPAPAPEHLRASSLDKPLPGSPMVSVSTFSLFPNNRKNNSQSDNTLAKTMSSQTSPLATRKATLDNPQLPPPPPVKNDSEQEFRDWKASVSQPRPQPSKTPSSPPREKALPAADFSISTPSPPRPQIWRRRSRQGSRDLPNLKLDYSHGSTADTIKSNPAPAAFADSSTNTATRAVANNTTNTDTTTDPSSLATISRTSHDTQAAAPVKPTTNPTAAVLSKPLPVPEPPQPSASGLPGRNIRPARSNNSKDETQTMGGASSKIQQLKNKLHVSRRSAENPASNRSESAAHPAANRPPTPEYQKEDVKTPEPSTFVSPISPASSPEPARDAPQAISKDLPPDPSQSGAQPEPKAISRKAVASPPSSALQSVKSLPDLQSPPSRTSEPPLPTFSADQSSRRQSPPVGAPGTRRRGESARPATREGSARPDPNRRPFPSRHSAPDSDPKIVRSDSRGSMFKGRDGTLYPMMKELKSPDPRAFSFPSRTLEPMAPGTVLKAAPLKPSHMNCFQKHRFMKRISNRHHPLSCQTCEREDAEDRFLCGFCGLRICESCQRAFDGYKRDLPKFVDSMGANTTSSAGNVDALGLSPP